MTYTVDRLNCIIAHYYIYQQTDRVRESVITCLGDQSIFNVVSSSVISAGSRCSTKLYNGYYYSCDYYYSSSLQIKRTDIPKQRTTKLRFKQQQNRVRIEYQHKVKWIFDEKYQNNTISLHILYSCIGGREGGQLPSQRLIVNVPTYLLDNEEKTQTNAHLEGVPF